ncbi:MAG: hypothetical protein ACOCQS_00165 [Bacillota bacterium]
MKNIGIVLIVLGIVGIILGVIMFSDIGIPALIGSLTSLLTGIALLKAKTRLDILENTVENQDILQQ